MSTQYFKDIFCIVGYERSGTTMLRTILSNSSEMNVHCIEPHYILEMYQIFGLKVTNIPEAVTFLYNHKKYPKPGSDLYKKTKERLSLETLQSLYEGLIEISLEEFILKFYQRLYAGNWKNKLLIKYPEFALHLNILEKIFPEIKIINMIRDPRSAIASSFARWPSKSFTYRCIRWNSSVSLTKKWGTKNPGHYMEVVYEKLLINFNDTLAKICQYLGILVEDQMIHFHYYQPQWSVNNDYTEKEFKGVDKTKLDSWKKQLKTSQVNLSEKTCKKWMKEYHYPFSDIRLEGQENYFFVLKDRIKYVFEFAKTKVLHKINVLFFAQ